MSTRFGSTVPAGVSLEKVIMYSTRALEFTGEVAGGPVVRFLFLESWYNLFADLFGPPTAGVEAASRRWVKWTRYVAAQDDALSP